MIIKRKIDNLDEKICVSCEKKYINKEIIEKHFRLVPDCVCLKREEEKLENYEEGKRLIEKIGSLKECGIGKIYRDKTFNNFDETKNRKAFGECLKYARKFIKNIAQGIGLFLIGSIGTGKTHLLAAIIDHVARLYKRDLEPGDLIYIKLSNLISEIGKSFSGSFTEEVISKYKEVPILFLDDLDFRNLKGYFSKTIGEIIEFRYENKLPTIMSSNENCSQFGKRLQGIITAMCKIVELEDGDHRLNK